MKKEIFIKATIVALTSILYGACMQLTEPNDNTILDTTTIIAGLPESEQVASSTISNTQEVANGNENPHITSTASSFTEERPNQLRDVGDIFECIWSQYSSKSAYIYSMMEIIVQDSDTLTITSDIVEYDVYNNSVAEKELEYLERSISSMYPNYLMLRRSCEAYSSYRCAKESVMRMYNDRTEIRIFRDSD